MSQLAGIGVIILVTVLCARTVSPAHGFEIKEGCVGQGPRPWPVRGSRPLLPLLGRAGPYIRGDQYRPCGGIFAFKYYLEAIGQKVCKCSLLDKNMLE